MARYQIPSVRCIRQAELEAQAILMSGQASEQAGRLADVLALLPQASREFILLVFGH